MNTIQPCNCGCGSYKIENKELNLCYKANKARRVEPKEKKVYKIPPQSKKGKDRAEKLKDVKKKITNQAKDSNQYYCRGCLTTAGHLDRSHILSVKHRPDLETDEANLNLFCRACHQNWESGEILKMSRLACFLKDMRYIFKNDSERFNKIFFKLLDENEARPTAFLSGLIVKIERFVP